MLMCNVKGCTKNNFPLKINATIVEKKQSDFNAEFVKHMLPRIDWSALLSACKDLSLDLPNEIPSDASENEEFLQILHNLIVDVRPIEMVYIYINIS